MTVPKLLFQFGERGTGSCNMQGCTKHNSAKTGTSAVFCSTFLQARNL